MKLTIFIIIAGIIIYWIIKYRSRSQPPHTPSSNTSQKVSTDPSTKGLQFSIAVKSGEVEKYKIVTSINGKPLEIISPTIDEESSEVSWIEVFYEGKHYGYGYEIETWVHSREGIKPGPPPQETEIVSAIKNVIDKFRPPDWPEDCIKTVYHKKGKNLFGVTGSVNLNETYHNIKAQMSYISETFTISTSYQIFTATLNFKTNVYNFPERMKHMEKAVVTWRSKEYAYYKNH
jgi:hypothetical protein